MASHTPQPFKTTRIAFALTLSAALIFSAAYVYLFSVVKNASERSATLEQEVRALEAQESELGQIRKNLSATEDRRTVLTSFFINASNIVPFLETIEGYGDAVGVVTTFDTVDIKKNPSRLDVTITASGSFANLYRYIAQLESAPYEFSITNTEVRSMVPPGLIAETPSTTAGGWEAKIALSVLSISGVE